MNIQIIYEPANGQPMLALVCYAGAWRYVVLENSNDKME